MSGNETMAGAIGDLVALRFVPPAHFSFTTSTCLTVYSFFLFRGDIVNANVTATEIRTEDVTAR